MSKDYRYYRANGHFFFTNKEGRREFLKTVPVNGVVLWDKNYMGSIFRQHRELEGASNLIIHETIPLRPIRLRNYFERKVN